MVSPTEKNAKVLQAEFDWFEAVLKMRIETYFDPKPDEPDPLDIPFPGIDADTTPYARQIIRYQLSGEERLVVLLALAPYLKPNLLDIFLTRNKLYDRPFTEFGGRDQNFHNGFLPTIQTALFLLSGNNLFKRLTYHRLFDARHIFRQKHLLDLEVPEKKAPFITAPLCLTPEFMGRLIYGQTKDPDWGEHFPAKRLLTQMAWEDLVLMPQTREQLSELWAWSAHGHELLNHWDMGKRLSPGYRCLFYGPPGTGKTLTAGLLGKRANLPVYRIDLSLVVSKYIGETEKNLEKIFQRAEQKECILFFDEADALFGKRTQISDAHDRYANQGTSYLLQRIENCPNIVILASNLKENLDDAFTRRFQSVIYFPIPRKKERLQLWQQSFSPASRLEKDIDIEKIAEKYEIAGGAIMNVIRYASLMAIARNTNTITMKDLNRGIQREYAKEGRTA